VISPFKNDLWRCTAGAVAVTTALVLPVLLGMASLGVEVSHWYLGQRQMQGAADAAAFSAAAQWIADEEANNIASTAYQTVGAAYASLNGFAIPTANVCLIPVSGADNCGTVRALDSRTIICNSPPCVVVEINQNTANWLSTKLSFEPGRPVIKAIPTPTLLARSIVRATSTTTTGNGNDCILALANDPQAIRIHGNGDPSAQCGFAVDGGLDQNAGKPVQGGITFNGANAKVNINSLTVAAKTANCPDGGAHCQQYNSTAPLTAVATNTATADPYASQVAALFTTTPLGVKTGGVAITKAGSGYTGATCTFTVTGGTYYTATSSPAQFTATISGGKVTAITAVTDPGAYAAFPTSPVSATDTCGGSGATFTLTEGCWTWNSALLPVQGTFTQTLAGRKYCSIPLLGAGKTNFPAGSYWIAGGDANCAGFCVASSNATVTSDANGVTFFLTHGEGAGTYGTSSYATSSITSGNVSLCAPGTGCSTTCSNSAGPTSCMLFIQNPAATTSTSLDIPGATVNSFAGNGSRTLSGLIYLPKQTFSETGNGPILGCVAVIAKYFDIGGTPIFADGCLPGNGIGGGPVTTWNNPIFYQ
jgi:Flp pilus assembly protein TadG